MSFLYWIELYTICSSELGLSVLMVEARDRVGGRTYTVESDGEQMSLLVW